MGDFPSERHSSRGEAPTEEAFDRSLRSLRPPSEEDPLERLSELRRRNSLVPVHLRSCYPVEMQDRHLPPDALTADSGLPAFPSRDISSPAPPDVGVGRQSRRGTEGAPSSTRGVEGSSSSSSRRSDRRWVRAGLAPLSSASLMACMHVRMRMRVRLRVCARVCVFARLPHLGATGMREEFLGHFRVWGTLGARLVVVACPGSRRHAPKQRLRKGNRLPWSGLNLGPVPLTRTLLFLGRK